MSVNGYKCTALTGGGAGALDAVAAAGLGDGDLAIVMASGSLYHYELDADSGLSEASPDVIRPDGEGGDKRWILQRVPQTNTVPAGVVVPYLRGYFSNGSNGGYASSYNSAAAVNALLNADGWYVCNGAALNLAGSPGDMFAASNRYLPNLTDDRFLMGDTAGGGVGGGNTMAHTHAISHTHTVDIGSFASGATALTAAQIPAHTHALSHTIGQSDGSGIAGERTEYGLRGTAITAVANTGGGGSHTHTVDPPNTTTGGASTGTSGAATNTENRPLFLSCLYIIKVLA
jgi:microcystin-dependent protein